MRKHLVAALLGLRERYPHWGPKKLRVKLGGALPGTKLPAASTLGDWLRKAGVTVPRRRRGATPPYPRPFAPADAPNAVWSVDFKGWFRTGEGARGDPLTLSGNMTRCLLACRGQAG